MLLKAEPAENRQTYYGRLQLLEPFVDGLRYRAVAGRHEQADRAIEVMRQPIEFNPELRLVVAEPIVRHETSVAGRSSI
jgi:hypothetical protein